MLHDPPWIHPHEFEEAFANTRHSQVTSVGFPVFEDDLCLVIAQQLGHDGSVADCMRILKAGIVGIYHTDGTAVPWTAGKDIFRYEHRKSE